LKLSNESLSKLKARSWRNCPPKQRYNVVVCGLEMFPYW